MNDEITTMDVMEMLEKLYNRFDALSDKVDQLSNKIDQLVIAVDQRFLAVETRLDRIESRLDKVEKHCNYHTTWLNRIEQNMVSKGQFNRLVRVLRHNNALSGLDAEHVVYQQ